MTGNFRLWWDERAPRERWLLGIMVALIGIVLLWLLVVRPVEAGLVSVKADHQAAIDRNAAIRSRLAALAALPPRGSRASTVPLNQLVTTSAGETGFTLTPRPASAPGGVGVTISAARPTALFGWLATLEAQGVVVDSVTVQPNGGGTISADVDMRQVEP